MEDMWSSMKTAINRRSFVKNGLTAAGVATVGAGLLADSSSVLAQAGPEEHSGRLTPGDAALLRFAAAAQILETDFWVQYNELGGIPNTSEVPGGSGNPAYTAAIQMLDSDMAQYIHDNTDDEFTHQNFLNAYLISKGADPVSNPRSKQRAAHSHSQDRRRHQRSHLPSGHREYGRFPLSDHRTRRHHPLSRDGATRNAP